MALGSSLVTSGSSRMALGSSLVTSGSSQFAISGGRRGQLFVQSVSMNQAIWTRSSQAVRRFSWLSCLWALPLAACSPMMPDDAVVAVAESQLLESWAQYTVNVGAHGASVSGATPGSPLSLFTTVAGRDYRFRFNPSASYVITRPTEPSDQLDWNKLPGISDCGTLDLSRNGAMFGWRWRIDLTPPVLEVTAYANNDGKHLWPTAPLFSLDAADLASDEPLSYRVWLDGSRYQFTVTGTVRGRAISATTTLPRSCAGTSATALKWASGLYFGGTSTAPSKITGHVSEIPFKP